MFTFVIATEILKEQDMKVKRIRNPLRKTYPQISLKYDLMAERDQSYLILEDIEEEKLCLSNDDIDNTQ